MILEPYNERFFPIAWYRYHTEPRKPVLHQQTCPVCGRTLVNTYKHSGTWKCRRCWEEAMKDV